MTLSQFNCPHCNNPFQVDAQLPSQQVACPHCAQPVALAAEPPITSEPPVAEPPPRAEPNAPPVASRQVETVQRDYSPADLLPPPPKASPDPEVEAPPSPDPEPVSSNAPPPAEPRRDHELLKDDFLAWQQTADERASKRFIKNTIVWTCCAIVLLVILAYFIRPGVS